MRRLGVWIGIVVLLGVPIARATGQQAKPAAEAPKQGQTHGKGVPASSTTELDGQRVFEQNCSRCHWAPDGISPRITGTVLRHMRVRALLSEQEEGALLKFMNP